MRKLTLLALIALDSSDVTRLRALTTAVTPLVTVAALHATLVGAIRLGVALLSE